MAKKAKKAAKKAVKKVVEVLAPPAPKPKASHSSINIRDHVEKHSGERKDCAIIWRVIEHNPQYASDEAVINLIKLKEYETLLGEVS